MNYVNRHIRDQNCEAARKSLPSSLLPSERKWPIRYDSIELGVVGADLIAILVASLFSSLLSDIRTGWSMTEVGQSVAHALLAASFFVSV